MVPLILLIEHDETQVSLIQCAFERAGLLNPLRVVGSGGEAMVYLEGAGPYVKREQFPLPGLILLDLKLPGIDGLALLRWIKQRTSLRDARIIALAESGSTRGLNEATELGAAAFFLKPFDFYQFSRFAEALDGCWVWGREKTELDPIKR